MKRIRPTMLLLFTGILIVLVFFGAQLKVPTASAYPTYATFSTATPTANTCARSGCHTGTNSPTGAVITFPSGMTSYTPGGPAIPLTITVPGTTYQTWGYQLNARMASNLAGAGGSFTAGDNGTTSGSGPSSTFTLNWTPPPAGTTDSVNFYLTGNNTSSFSGSNLFSTGMYTLTPAAAAPPADFSLSASPYTLTQGGNGTSTITVTPQNGFSGSVALSVSGLPSGVTASSFNPGSTTSTSVLTLTASSTAATGTYSVMITGTSGSLSHTATLSLTVNPSPTPPNFSLSASPYTLTQGGNGTSTITVTGQYGFTGSVALSVSGLPSGVTASAFNPASTTNTSVLTLTASSTAATGTYSVMITGTSGMLTHTATLTLTVNSTISTSPMVVSPTSLTFKYQSGGSTSGTQSLTVTHSGGRYYYWVSTSGGTWLTASPTSGRTPGTITVSVNASGMSSGTYSGTIQVRADDAGGKTVPVTLIVTASGCVTNCSGTGTAIYAQPYVTDPSLSGTLYAQWVDRLGVPTGNPTSPVDPGLVLSKNATAPAGSFTGAYIRNIPQGSPIPTELGFDQRVGSQCTLTSPRVVIVASVSGTHTLGCSTATITTPTIGTSTTPVAGWNRLRFNMSAMAQAALMFVPGDTITSMTIVQDQGPDPAVQGSAGGFVVIDNIDINGTFAGKATWTSTDR